MAGDEGVARWIVEKIQTDPFDGTIKPLGRGFLEVTPSKGTPFTAAAIGVSDVVTRDAVAALFTVTGIRPEFVVNVPSKAIWRGDAITLIHSQPAAFGTFGELFKAAREERAHSYRHREYKFFESAFRQHQAVSDITRLYDKVFQLHRGRGLPDITVILIDAYDMSAEDIRNAREQYGHFDAAVKISSYGTVTTAAKQAAEHIGAEAFRFGEIMGRLNKK